MEHAAGGTDLGLAVALLAAGVVAVPLFRLLGLGAVLGYLTAGVLVGPFALKLFNDPQAVLHIAELGVVMFLFLIGLEMRPAKLWAMRRDIFGLGLAQVLDLRRAAVRRRHCLWLAACRRRHRRVRLRAVLHRRHHEDDGRSRRSLRRLRPALRRHPAVRRSRHHPAAGAGRHPRLASCPARADTHPPHRCGRPWRSAVGAVALVFVAGRYLMNPLFGIPRLVRRARSDDGSRPDGRARRCAVHAAGAASRWRMGAFLAGVLLSESTFRHQLEADVEPFRGILLGLFFLGVGMSLDLNAGRSHNWQIIARRRRLLSSS